LRKGQHPGRRSRTRYRMGDVVVQLRAAITLSPANPDLHAQLSQGLASTGQLEPEIAERKAALHLRADDADDWNNLGVLEAREIRISFGLCNSCPIMRRRAAICSVCRRLEILISFQRTTLPA